MADVQEHVNQAMKLVNIVSGAVDWAQEDTRKKFEKELASVVLDFAAMQFTEEEIQYIKMCKSYL